MAMMEVTQTVQVSGSNAMGPSASAIVDDEAVPGHSFLMTLCCPQAATIDQPASTWEAKVSCTWHLQSQSVTPSRVREFPDEHLTVSASKLFCQACREELRVTCETTLNHA